MLYSPVVGAPRRADRGILVVVDEPLVGGVPADGQRRKLGGTEVRAVGIQVPRNQDVLKQTHGVITIPYVTIAIGYKTRSGTKILDFEIRS